MGMACFGGTGKAERTRTMHEKESSELSRPHALVLVPFSRICAGPFVRGDVQRPRYSSGPASFLSISSSPGPIATVQSRILCQAGDIWPAFL